MTYVEKQIETARQAINDVFNETWIDPVKARESLNELRERIDLFLTSLDE